MEGEKERRRVNVHFFERLRRLVPHRFRLYYSGNLDESLMPENLHPDPVDVMMSYYDMPCKRFTTLLKARGNR